MRLTEQELKSYFFQMSEAARNHLGLDWPSRNKISAHIAAIEQELAEARLALRVTIAERASAVIYRDSAESSRDLASLVAEKNLEAYNQVKQELAEAMHTIELQSDAAVQMHKALDDNWVTDQQSIASKKAEDLALSRLKIATEALEIYADPSTFADDGPFCTVPKKQFAGMAREALAKIQKEGV